MTPDIHGIGNKATVTAPSDREVSSQERPEKFNTKHMRRVLFSSFLGSAIEFYDFMLYATAASIVFGQVFFTQMTPALALVASFATMATGYLARPLGALIFGPIGDRMGRKTVLIMTLTLMGVTSALIGLLPTYAMIGATAPILLITLRIVQGIAVGGEWGGSMLIAMEHSPGRRRGFAASFANMGGPAGALCATAMIGLFAALPDEQFYAWGWRIPFLFSLVLVAIGLFVRLKIAETPVFQQLAQKREEKMTPVRDIFTTYWKQLLLAIVAGVAPYVTQGIFVIWSTALVVQHGMDRTLAINLHIPTAFALILAIALSSHLSDRFGRRPVMAFGVVAGIVLAFPMMMLLETATFWGVLIAMVVAQFLMQGFIFGPFAAFTAELFPTRMRYTGSSLAYQTASTLGAGFAPIIATALYASTGNTSITPVSIFLIVIFVLSGLAIWLSREGSKVNLESAQ
ncbi:MFS transporter [Arthrobacter sp. H14]|uniref:MFS transporter n=1 Tax=Arthrobacter sp. H14 TaxID=1312959 RepID=UPI0004AF6002|nr:MFS transporter [Arthrobacter sp. H14]